MYSCSSLGCLCTSLARSPGERVSTHVSASQSNEAVKLLLLRICCGYPFVCRSSPAALFPRLFSHRSWWPSTFWMSSRSCGSIAVTGKWCKPQLSCGFPLVRMNKKRNSRPKSFRTWVQDIMPAIPRQNILQSIMGCCCMLGTKHEHNPHSST